MPISLVAVLTSCRSSSRATVLAMAFLAPFVITGILLLVHLAFSYDEPHSPGWPFAGTILVLIPSVIVCVATALVCNWLTHRRSRE